MTLDFYLLVRAVSEATPLRAALALAILAITVVRWFAVPHIERLARFLRSALFLALALGLAPFASCLVRRPGGDPLRDLGRAAPCRLASLDVLVLPLALRTRYTARWRARTSTNFVSVHRCNRKIRTTRTLARYASPVTRRLAMVLLLSVVACGPAAFASDDSSSGPIAMPTSPREPGLPTPTPIAGGGGPPGIGSPALVPTPEPSAPATREIAGIDFALLPGPTDLRIEAALSRDDQEAVAATVAADIPAVESEFERSFTTRPVIYVFGGTEGYTEGFVRIFGYPRATATFVAENSVSFFEPSLRLIAVNWAAVGDRRPVAAIRHELTHLLTLDACSPRCDLVPAWFNEGEARLMEAQVPGSDWRLVRVRYEAASMAATGTLIPLNTLVSQLSWNALTDWAGYFKYQESARAVELFREDVGGAAPIARVYERLRRGQNLAQAYAALTGRSFNDFVAGLSDRMRAAVPAGQGLIPVASTSYLVYGFPPASTITLTVSGPRGSESSPMVISPFGSNFDGIAATRARGGYTISAQTESGVFTIKLRKVDAGVLGDLH
jgi:hypothetical protein